MIKKASETQIEKLMRVLEISEAEALQVIADDKAIDKGEKLFELTDEQKKVAKKMTISTSANKKIDSQKPKQTRTIKENETKNSLIADLAKWLLDSGYSNVEILNKSRLIGFSAGNDNFELTLVQKRAKK